MDKDWERIRLHAISDVEPPPHWPQGVRPISMSGLTLLGLDKDHRHYWGGNAVEFRWTLTVWQKLAVVAVTVSAVVGDVASALQAYVALAG